MSLKGRKNKEVNETKILKAVYELTVSGYTRQMVCDFLGFYADKYNRLLNSREMKRSFGELKNSYPLKPIPNSKLVQLVKDARDEQLEISNARAFAKMFKGNIDHKIIVNQQIIENTKFKNN